MSAPDLETAAATWREWFARGELDEGRTAMERALAAPGADAPTPERVRVLYAAGVFAFRQNAYGAAWLKLNRAGLALARADREAAATLFEEGKARLEVLGAALDPDDRFEFDCLSRELRAGVAAPSLE